MQNIRAAAVQMISSTDPDANTAAMKRLVRQAAEQGADWVLLPEYWPLMGRNDTDKLAVAEPLVSGSLGETRYARFQTAFYHWKRPRLTFIPFGFNCAASPWLRRAWVRATASPSAASDWGVPESDSICTTMC